MARRAIALLLNLHISTVGRWLARSRESIVLTDAPRSGRPATFDDAFRTKAIAFYCQAEPLPGCARWALSDAITYMKDHPDVLGRPVSRSTLHRILTSHSLRPYRRKYYLAITDPDFFPKMDHVLGLLHDPPDYLFCFDECTCIQALTPLAPDWRTGLGHTRCRESQYRRNGTTDLIAFLRYRDGEVFGRCTPNHQRHTLIQVFREHVEQYPSDATLHYLCDNLNTHFHDDLCQAVAELSRVPYVTLPTGAQRRDWLQSDDKRIVIHFLPFHGSWLNPIEIWFGILKRKVLAEGWFEDVEDVKQTIRDFIESTWNPLLAHPFNFTYTGEGLHDKAVRRLIFLLDAETPQMDVKFLNKQLHLVTNLVQGYNKHVEGLTWDMLVARLHDKSGFIHGLLGQDPATTQRLHVEQTLSRVLDLLHAQMA